MRIGVMGPDAHGASVMHRTETLDYAVVLAGTCDMELDNGEMIRGLKAGDVVIQRGTNNKWIVRGSAPVRFLFVLIDANTGRAGDRIDRKSVVWGKRGKVRVDRGGRRVIPTKKKKENKR